MNEFELRRALGELPTDRSPATDLWAGIEARLAPRRFSRNRTWAWLSATAAAAAVLMVGLNLSVYRSSPPASAVNQGASHTLPLIADALAFEYQSALSTLPPTRLRPPALQAADIELEVAAADLRAALDQSPRSTYLLDQLRRTYALRLRLQRTSHVS